MNPSTFEDFTKALASSASRRQALKTIAATTLGGILGLGGIGTAFGAPKCHRQGTGCDTTSQCCSPLVCTSGKCSCPSLPTCDVAQGCSCPSGHSCVNGTCCPNSQVCNGVCCPSGQGCCN